jgi:hypothetical protein
MSRTQYGTPTIIEANGAKAIRMERINLGDLEGNVSEAWLQERLFENPNLLPLEEIDPAFVNAIPVCRELITNVGPLDLLYVNEDGLLILVECKLWRNPEARRKVVGQILDYAQDIARMDYEELLARINRRIGRSGNSLFDIVSERIEGLSEAQFTDAVSRNLRRGRFLTLVVGDGIRESVENISQFLQVHAQLAFTFALVEAASQKLLKSEVVSCP